MKRSWSSPIIVVVLYQLLGVASAKQPAVSYSGGDGSSVAKAVVIKAPHEEFGVKAEYTFIQIHYGRYETVSQGVSHEKKRTYDIIIFRTPDGRNIRSTLISRISLAKASSHSKTHQSRRATGHQGET